MGLYFFIIYITGGIGNTYYYVGCSQLTPKCTQKKSTFKAKISEVINIYIRCIITHLSNLCLEMWICHRGL